MTIKSRHGRFASFVIVILFFALLGLLTEAVRVPMEVFSLGLVIVAISLVPIFSWIRSESRSIPMFQLICVSYGLQYGFAVYSQPNSLVIQNQLTELPWPYILKAQGLALLGICGMIVSFWATVRVFKSGHAAPADLPLMYHQRTRLIFFGVGLSLLGGLLHRAGTGWLGGVMRLLDTMPLLAMAVLALAVYAPERRDTRTWEKTALWVLTAWLCFVGLGTAMLENAFIPIVVVLIIRMAKVRSISMALLGLTFVVMSTLNGVKMDARAELRNAEATMGNLSWGYVKVWTNTIKDADYSLMWKDKPEAGKVAFWRTLLDRFGLLNRFGWVCMNTPERVPFFMGETYKYFLYAPIPRFAWPGKPEASEATATLDYAYLLRDVAQGYTYAIGVGYIPEAYANFSWPGVIFVLMLEGVVFGILDQVLNRERSYGGAAIFVIATIGFMNGIGATSIMLFGNIAQIVLCSILIVYLFSGRLRIIGRGRPTDAELDLRRRHAHRRPFPVPTGSIGQREFPPRT